jgi:L-fucose mutarotase
LIWDDFTATLLKYGIPKDKIGFYERYAFYEQAAKAYCIVETGEKQRYGNVILKKGVL